MTPNQSIKDLFEACKYIYFLDFVICNNEGFSGSDFHLESDLANSAVVASYNNGSGANYFIVFRESSAVIQGYDHESEYWKLVSQRKIRPGDFYIGLRSDLKDCLVAAGVPMNEVSFCFWKEGESPWQSAVPDSQSENPIESNLGGAKELLVPLDYTVVSTESYLQSQFGDVLSPDFALPPDATALSLIEASTIRQLAPNADIEVCLQELARVRALRIPSEKERGQGQ